MAFGNSVNATQNGVQSINNGVWTGNTVTNHATLVGGASNAITSVGPSGTAGQVLQSGGASADPSYSTATYPSTAGTSGKILQSNGTNIVSSTPTFPTTAGTAGKVLISDGTNIVSSTPTYPNTATGTGSILRADGTNWTATTTTYPNTNAINTLLYASAANVMSALATANSGVLTTSATGVPAIDTTNFAVLTTGVQMKGNNANTAPPAGFIGEQIRSFIPFTSAVSLTNATTANITSISLTAGIWDVSCLGSFFGPTAGSQFSLGITTVSATMPSATTNGGDNRTDFPFVNASGNSLNLSIPAYRMTLSGTTTVFFVALSGFTVGTCNVCGRISATRVG